MTKATQYLVATVPALAILGFFVWFANWIPQTRWDPPARHEITANMTPAQMASVGETIARQRGCMACHTIEPGVGAQGGGRGPNWADIAVRRAQGVPGGPGNLVEYLAQALHEPGAYLVEGYANIMPAATAAPAKLTYEEVVAVVNYLQSLGGKPSVKVGDIPRPSGESAAPPKTTVTGPVTILTPRPSGESTAPPKTAVTDPVTILANSGCTGCHSLKAGEIRLGPPLDAANLKKTASQKGMSPEAYILESIVKPKAFEKEGFLAGVMPQDYGDELTAGQLEALVKYLLSPGGEQ